MWKLLAPLVVCCMMTVDACSCIPRNYGNSTYENQRSFCENVVVLRADIVSEENVTSRPRFNGNHWETFVLERLYPVKVLDVLKGDRAALERPGLKFRQPGDRFSCSVQLDLGEDVIIGGSYRKDKHEMELSTCAGFQLPYDQETAEFLKSTDCTNKEFTANYHNMFDQ